MSVINDFQVNGLFPATVGGSGSVVKYFPRLLGTSIGVESVAPSATNANGQLVVNGNNALNGQWFEVLIGGNILAGNSDSSTNVEVALYAQTSTVLTSPTYTKIATTGAVSMPFSNTNYVFALKVQLIGDSASGVVRGLQKSVVGSAAWSSEATLTANLSGVNFGSQAPFGLVVGVTFTDSDAANLASLYQFQIAAA
jgi:hypothetical protein